KDTAQKKARMKTFFLHELSAVGLCVLSILMPFSSATAVTITVAYNERPPYLVSNPDGTVSGLTATPVANAFHQAEIPFVWEKNPTNRQLQILKESGGMYCAVGWFKNPAHEKFAKFTKAVYRDKPSIVIVNLNFSAPPDTSLAEILTRPDVHVLVKDQYSYDPYVDGLFARLKPALVQTTAENINMIRMIKVGSQISCWCRRRKPVISLSKRVSA
ncbi:MAG: hypothetical protein KGM99_06770, partial [Burkholderiales bacterium]|nr:hypothetical protein [Burkholderiales bacterium]